MWLGLILAALPVDAAVLDASGADPCRWAERIPASLERLPTLTITSSAAVRVEVRVAPEGLILTLTDGAQHLARRTLPNDGACEARADGVALVVEQQLRSLGYVPPLPPVPPPAPDARSLPPPPPPISTPPPPVLGPPPSPVATATTAPPPPPVATATTAPPPPPVATASTAPPFFGPLRLWVGAHGVLEAPGEAGLRGGGQLELALRSAPRRGPDTLGVLLQVGLLAPGSVDVVRADAIRGTLSVWSLLITAGAEACWAVPGGAACGLGRAGVERVQGRSDGDQVFRAASAAPVRPALLVGARYRFLALDPLALELGVEALLRPKPASFEVEDGAAYEDAPVALRVGLGGSFGIP